VHGLPRAVEPPMRTHEPAPVPLLDTPWTPAAPATVPLYR
jgi:hypothetical protein